MEKGYIFHPPPFLGSGFRQNHQIRMLKTNSYPILPSYRTLAPSSSHTAPSLALLTSRGTASGPNFSRTPLISHRRKHLRRCYDLMHICIQRRQVDLAARFLKVILAAHEWTTDEGWWMALLILSLTQSGSEVPEEGEQEMFAQGSRRKIGYLQMLDLDSSAPFKATHLTPSLVREYIATNRLSDAIELLEQRVNVHPYKRQPELHATLGMLYLFVGVQALLNRNRHTDGEGEPESERQGVSLKTLDRATRQKSRMCFETAIQVSEAWLRGETLRRQRIWGMRRQEEEADRGKLQTRKALWGWNPIDDDDEDGWPNKEHKQVRRVRKRLERRSTEYGEGSDEGDGGSGSNTASSASGTPYSASDDDGDDGDDDNDDTQQEQREHSLNASRLQTDTPTLPNRASPEPELEPEDAPTSKGPRAWARVWPSIAPIWKPTPPFAYHLAQQFLLLLAPHPKSQRRTRKLRSTSATYHSGDNFDTNSLNEEDEDGGLVMNDGLQLTQEEAERRLRAILFEDADAPDPGRSGTRPEVTPFIVKGEASQRDNKRKRTHDRHG